MQKIDRHIWIDILRSGYGPSSPTSRLVLFTLNLYMDKSGEAFPSIRTIAASSKLTTRSVCTHIDKLVVGSWLKKKIAGKTARDWKLHKYFTNVPDGEYVISRNMKTVRISVVGGEYTSTPHSQKVLKDTQHHEAQGVEPDTQGVERGEKMVLKEIPTNSSENTIRKSRAANSGVRLMREILTRGR